jgi:polyisoprenoid-binding protein YceI
VKDAAEVSAVTRLRAGRFSGPAGRGLTQIVALVVAVWIGVHAGSIGSAAAATAASPPPGAAGRFAIVPAASTVTYRVGETFVMGNQFATAVGTTHAVQGDVFVDRAHPANSRIGTITIDISTFQSDRARRDRAIREGWLESAKFPTATFTPTAIHGLPATYTEGQEIPVQVLGNLRVRDVTKPVTFTGTVKLATDTLSGNFQTTVLMTDFGFEPPSILGTLKAENQVKLELQFTAQRTPA